MALAPLTRIRFRTLRIVVLTMLLAWLLPVLLPMLSQMTQPQVQAPWLEVCRSPKAQGLEGQAAAASRVGRLAGEEGQDGRDGERPHGIACPSCVLSCPACAPALVLLPGSLDGLRSPAARSGPLRPGPREGSPAEPLLSAALPRAPPAA